MAEAVTRPAYLRGGLADRWDALAPELTAIGALDALNAETLAKYLLAENEYLRVSELVQRSIGDGDADEAGKWIAAQDRLTRQVLALADALGMTPESRRRKGLKAPRKGKA